MMADKDDGEWFVWLFFGGLAVWFAYEHWWKVEDLPKPPAPLYVANSRPTGSILAATSPSGTRYFVMAESVRGSQTERLGWVSMDHSQDKSRPQRTSKELYIVNCETGAYRNPSFAAYDAEGEVKYNWDESDDDKAKVKYAIPETVGGSVVSSLCDPRYDPPREIPTQVASE
jgi:hypothetical protein